MFDRHSQKYTFIVHLLSLIAVWFAVFTASCVAQSQSEVIVSNRITQPVNPDERITLRNNVHPLAQARFDQGAAPRSMTTGRIMLILQRSDAQDRDLKQYLADLQDPTSFYYRKWLTPAQFGARYGISDTDLATVTSWLESQGFTVEKVSQARNVIIFSGNMAQVQQAFRTSVHRYIVNGETHYANSSDPQIPAALAPVISGIAQLHDFRPKAGAILKSTAHFDSETKTIEPDLTLTNGKSNFLFVDPADAATIYDTSIPALNPKYTGATYDGTGVTIGIAGDSNFEMVDILNYRGDFLQGPYSTNLPKLIIDGNNPEINGDALEALLDLEVSGGIAPGATINFYTAANTDVQSGLFLAIYRALEDNVVSILNVSFGGCEAFQGTSGNLLIRNAWEQAAAQGISVTVSTGDDGSAGCDNQNTEVAAKSGLAVNALASTPYDIAVGGTDFDILSSAFSTYVGASNAASNRYRTALSYIPENPWNDSPITNSSSYATNSPRKDSKGNTTIWAGSGGISSCTQSTASGTTVTCAANSGYVQPSFQSGITSYSVRAVPDVSFLAADGASGALWLVCSDNVSNGSSTASTDCQTNGGQLSNSTTFTGVGGTSAAAPAFAAMLALVSQSQGGVRLGQADYVLYNLASQAALYGTVFHDVTVGNNSVYCQSGSSDCGSNSFLTGYNAVSGYDAATGLGSVDVAQLIANWRNVKFTASSTTLQMGTDPNVLSSSPSISVSHGTTLYFGVGVNPTTATGNVVVINNNSSTINGSQLGGIGFVSNNSPFLMLTNGVTTGTSNTLPGGSYTVTARYGGDNSYAASTSNGISVNVSQEPSTTILTFNTYDASTGNLYTGSTNSIPYGLVNFAAAQPVCNSTSHPCIGTSNGSTVVTPDGVATGSVNFADNGGLLAEASIASDGAAAFMNYPNNIALSLPFSVGSHSFTAQYYGDASFGASTSTVGFTVVPASSTTTATSSLSSVGSSTSVTVSVTVGADSVGEPPSGTIQLYNGSTAIGSAIPLKTAYNSTTGLVQSTASMSLTGSQLTAAQTAKMDSSAFPWRIPEGAIATACVLFLVIPARRRSWRSLIALIAVAIVLSSVIGCGGGGTNSRGTGVGGGSTSTSTASITAKYGGDSNYAASTSAAITIAVTQ